MLFKNLICFQLINPWTLSAQALEAELAKKPLVPCPATQMEVSGWTPVMEKAPLVIGMEQHILFALGTEKRVLPGAVIKEFVEEKAVQYAEEHGHPPSRKWVKDAKEAALAELLPRAFTFRKSVLAWINPQSGRFYVDAGSAKTAEDVATKLRDTLADIGQEFPLQLLETKQGPLATMTSWVNAGSVNKKFNLGEACELQNEEEGKKTIRYSNHPLSDDQELARVRENIETGMSVSKLELVYEEAISFTVNAKLEVKRMQIMDTKDEAPAAAGGGSAIDGLMADFLLMAGSLTPVLAELEKVFDVKPVTALKEVVSSGHESFGE